MYDFFLFYMLAYSRIVFVCVFNIVLNLIILLTYIDLKRVKYAHKLVVCVIHVTFQAPAHRIHASRYIFY